MDYKKLNDYEIVYMIKENDDEESRNLLLKKYIPMVNKISFKYRDYAKKYGIEFDDLRQEGLIALNNAISNFDSNNGALFYTYSSVCIERHLITFCKRANNLKNYALNNCNNDDDDYYIIPDEKNTMDNYLFERFIEENFFTIKNSFDIKYSTIFELRYNGFSYKEISDLLDIPLTTIDGRMYRLKKSLHFKLRKD